MEEVWELVENADNLEKIFKTAKGEAESFGNDGLYMGYKETKTCRSSDFSG